MLERGAINSVRGREHGELLMGGDQVLSARRRLFARSTDVVDSFKHDNVSCTGFGESFAIETS